MIVMPTAAMLMFAIWPGVRLNSCLITGISGATANHAKKQTKNAIQLMWKARMAGVENEKRRICVSFFPLGFMGVPAGGEGSVKDRTMEKAWFVARLRFTLGRSAGRRAAS